MSWRDLTASRAIGGTGRGWPRGDTGAGELFRRGWWAMVLRGVCAILLGILMLSRPAMSLSVFVGLFGVYLFLDGLFTLAATFSAAREKRSWWPYLFVGLLSVAAGISAFARPTSVALFLVLFIGARALIVGAVEIGTGIAVRRTTRHTPWMLWLGGAASLLLGIVLFAYPAMGLLALIRTAGVYAIVFGTFIDAEAFRLRSFARGLGARTT